MKVLTNRINKQTGGINRRVYEMKRFVNSCQEHCLVIVGVSDVNKLETCIDGRVVEYQLPFSEWQEISPGVEGEEIPEQLRSLDSFKTFVLPTHEILASIIEKEQPDVCFVQGAFYFPWTILLAADSYKVPSVQLYCGSTQTEVIDEELGRVYFLLERQFAEFPRKTIFNSKLGKAKLEAILAREFTHSPIVPNGFPIEYSRLVAQVPEAITLGWVGRNVPVKNLDYLLVLREFLPSQDYPIHVVTNISANDPRSDLFEGKGIVIKQQVNPEGMDRFYERVSCVISTSFFEFFANVIAEAIASGRVPIVPKNSGVAELLLNNGLGDLVVNLDDVECVAQLIKRSKDYTPKVLKAREILTAEFSWDRVIKKYFHELANLSSP